MDSLILGNGGETSSTTFTEQPSHIRWFMIQSTDNSQSLSKLSPFVIGKALKCQIGDLKTVKRLQRGDLLVEAATAAQSNLLQKLSDIAGNPVKVDPHRSLNVCKGVIRCREIALCNKDEIIKNLSHQGVTDAAVIMTGTGEERHSTNTVILTFQGTQPPKFITSYYLRIPVSIYIPNPLRCYNCQKFGHGSRTCKGHLTCARCGTVGHSDKDCTDAPRCVNCTGSHAAYSKDCPKWAIEKRIQQLKAERNISFVEARKLVTTQQSENANRYATAVTKTQPTCITTSTNSKKPLSTSGAKICSIATQTDLTWPSGVQTPMAYVAESTNSACQTSISAVSTSVFTTDLSTFEPSASTSNIGASDHDRGDAFATPVDRLSGKVQIRTPPSSDKGKVKKKPRINRPPVMTQNMFDGLEGMQEDENSSS
jgi:hypothetical protein